MADFFESFVPRQKTEQTDSTEMWIRLVYKVICNNVDNKSRICITVLLPFGHIRGHGAQYRNFPKRCAGQNPEIKATFFIRTTLHNCISNVIKNVKFT